MLTTRLIEDFKDKNKLNPVPKEMQERMSLSANRTSL
jgi:hypothetical protein